MATMSGRARERFDGGREDPSQRSGGGTFLLKHGTEAELAIPGGEGVDGRGGAFVGRVRCLTLELSSRRDARLGWRRGLRTSDLPGGAG